MILAKLYITDDKNNFVTLKDINKINIQLHLHWYLVPQIILYSPLFPIWGTLFFGVRTPFVISFLSSYSLFFSYLFPKVFKTGNAIFGVLTPFIGVCSPVPRVPHFFCTHREKKKETRAMRASTFFS